MKKSCLLVIITTLLCVPLYAQITTNYEVGSYGQDLSLRILPNSTFDNILYRFLGYQKTQLLAYEAPIVLSTPAGTKRQYHLEIFLSYEGSIIDHQIFEYIIDKEAPGTPLFDIPSGTYEEGITIRPILADIGSTIQYRLTGPEGEENNEISTNERIHLEGRSGQFSVYEIIGVAVDKFGNRSSQEIFRFRIDRRKETSIATIPILSPVEGDFANRQLLYIDNRGFNQLRYTTNGLDPSLSGDFYEEPILLESGEDIQLRVYGRTHDNKELYETLWFSAGRIDYVNVRQGKIFDDVTITPHRAGLTYRTDDIDYGNLPFEYPVILRVTPGSLHTSLIRIMEGKQVYRYFFSHDSTPPLISQIDVLAFNSKDNQYEPAAPELFRSPESPQFLLRSTIQQNERVFYTLDGTVPSDLATDPKSLPLSVEELFGRIPVTIPANTDFFQLTVQSLKDGAVWGEPRREDFFVSNTSAAAPAIQVDHSFQDLTIKSPTRSVVYFDPPIIDAFYLPSEETVRIPLPPGVKQDVRITARSVDIHNGGLGEETVQNVRIDTFDGIKPKIVVSNGTEVSFQDSEEKQVFYRILSSNQRLPGNKQFEPAVTNLSLRADRTKNSVFIVEAYVEENQISHSDIIPVHNVHPPRPELLGISEGGSIRASDFSLYLDNPSPGFDYYYSIGRSNRSPPDPFTAGNRAYSRIPVPVDPLEKFQEVRVRVIAVSPISKNLRSPAREVRFFIDNQPPDLPQVSGVASGAAYSESVEFTIDGDEGDKIFYQLQNSRGEILVAPDSPYTGPVSVDAIDEDRTIYVLSTYSIDAVGNRSEPHQVRFLIDTVKPTLPQVRVRSNGRDILSEENSGTFFSESPIAVSIESNDKIVYELRRVSSALSEPSNHSATLTGDLILDTAANTETTFTFLFRTADEAGNLSDLSKVYQFVVDKSPPDLPVPPKVLRDGNNGTINWLTKREDVIEYVISTPDLRPEDLTFAPYVDPVSWRIPNQTEKLLVYYRTRDRAGLLSSVQLITIPFLNIATLPKIIGVQDGQRYHDSRYVEMFPTKDGIIRYEITTDGSEPGSVTSGSDVWSPFRIDFDPGGNQAQTYIIKVRQYVSGYEPSPELQFSFVIDKKLPDPPTLRLFPESNIYSMEPFTLDFLHEPNGRVVFRLAEYRFERGEIPQNWGVDFLTPSFGGFSSFRDFFRTADLPGSPDELILYRLEAYTYDEAGNRSRAPAQWNIAVDLRNVFVQAGVEGRGRGTLSEPFSSINDALKLVSEEARSEVYISEGEYHVFEPISFSHPLKIYGSYRKNSWIRELDKVESHIYADKSLSGSDLFSIPAEAELQLSGLNVNGSVQGLRSVFNIQGSTFSFSDGSIIVSDSNSAILAENGSLINILRSELQGYELNEARVLDLRNSNLEFISSQLYVEDEFDNRGGRNSNYVLLGGQDARVRIDDSSIRSGAGDNTIAVHLVNSDFRAQGGSVFSSGYGRFTASALVAEDSQLELVNSRITGSPEANIVSLIVAKNSDIVLQSSKLNLEAGFGVNGILLSQGSLELRQSFFQGRGAQDFVKGIVARDRAELNITDSDFSGAVTSDYTLATIEGSRMTFANNRLELGGNEQDAAVVSFTTNSAASLTDNTFIGTVRGIAIILPFIDDIDLTVSRNTFIGWGALLREEGRRQNRDYKTFERIQQDGFTANKEQ